MFEIEVTRDVTGDPKLPCHVRVVRRRRVYGGDYRRKEYANFVVFDREKLTQRIGEEVFRAAEAEELAPVEEGART